MKHETSDSEDSSYTDDSNKRGSYSPSISPSSDDDVNQRREDDDVNPRRRESLIARIPRINERNYQYNNIEGSENDGDDEKRNFDDNDGDNDSTAIAPTALVIEDEQIMDTDVDEGEILNGITNSDTVKNSDFINQGEDFIKEKVEFIDDHKIFLRSLNTPELRILSSTPFIWNGIEWSTLLILQVQKNAIGVFTGYEHSSHFPSNFNLRLRLKYQILDEKDDVLFSSSTPINEFTFTRSLENRRFDFGAYESFTGFRQILVELQRSSHNGDSFGLRIKTIMETVFMPATHTIGYNSKASTGMVGLENLGATCYLNALLQMLYHINEFRRAVYKLPHEDETFKSSTTLALQSVFKNLQISNKEVTTKDLTVAFGWTTQESFLQQDVQEMMRVLLDKLEDKMRSTVVDGCIKKLFAGTVRSFIKCVNVNYESNREEDFYDIQLDVKGCKNIYESFKKYIEIETLDGDNQYAAGDFGKQDARKGVIFTKFPPVLTIHLKRFDFDMQTMGFAKIHDHYEFPLELELDEFLVKPEENSENNDNNDPVAAPTHRYLLHSVLVHSGDVAGGHYYAYIRPSTPNFDYSSLTINHTNGDIYEENKNISKGQWFKFNDEVVLPVKKYEAVDYCFGRKEGSGYDKLRVMSSAYMLVYLRENEASQIMKEVHLDEIPSDLLQRLDSEMKNRRIHEFKVIREQLFHCILICQEKDYIAHNTYNNMNLMNMKANRNDNDYENDQDHECQTFFDLLIMKNSFYIHALLKIADYLKTSPINIRLWDSSKKAFRNNYVKFNEHIDKSDYLQTIQCNAFFVQELPPLAPSEQQIFSEKYELILAEEQAWLDNLRIELFKLEEYCEIHEDDPVEGCGIGSCNQPLQDLLNFPDTEEMAKSLRSEIDRLNEAVIDLFKEHDRDNHTVDDRIVFFKVFDPLNHLGNITQSGTNTMFNLNHVEPVEPDDVLLDELLDTIMKINPINSEESYKSLPIPKEYNPMKYIGYISLPLNTFMCDLVKFGKSLLSNAFHRSNIATEGKVTFPEIWSDATDYRVSLTEQSRTYVPKYGNNNCLSHINNISTTVSIILDIPNITKGAQQKLINIPSYTIITPSDWLLYTTLKREFHVKPYSPRDSEIANKIINKVKESFILVTKNDTKNQNNNNSNNNNRNNMNNNNPKQTLEAISSAIPSLLSNNFSFSLDLPINYEMIKVIHLISSKLFVYDKNLILYIAPKNDPEAHERVSPITLKNIQANSLQTYFENCKLSYGKKTKFIIFYRFSPYPITGRAIHNNISHTQRICEIRIVDERIRKWRKMFLLANNMLSNNNSKIDEIVTIHNNNHTEEDDQRNKRRKINDEKNENDDNNDNETNEINQQILPLQTNALQPLWPSPNFSEYDILDVNKVCIDIESSQPITRLVDELRKLLGIPTNIKEFMPIESYIFNPNSELFQIFSSNDYKPYKYSQVSSGLVSELIKTIKHKIIDSSLHSQQKKNDNIDIEFDTSDSEDDLSYEIELDNPMMLAVMSIRLNIINEILPAVGLANDLVKSWPEATAELASLYQTAVQHISFEDMIFMRNEHPTIRSIIVTVYNFTLLGNICDSCEPDLFSGPFLSYIREDDDLTAIYDRFYLITGDEDISKCRLAVVKNNIPYFIAKPIISQSSSVVLSNTPTEDMNNDITNDSNGMVVDGDTPLETLTATHKSETNIWSLLRDKYEEYLTDSWEKVRNYSDGN
eukprot:gene10572-14200_t